ncbi:hypothetical protein [Paracoccus sp. S1E-3]|uniref:hypothetical protein n=1 Tax=Paracoccus sp. S1E-3 TaxID=2756130 RepID=UPI0015EF7D6F|nr:hypothetical protein [Paracoccus sp. S1E-3]MBA4490220.1 hypothetical protein [Paracoccus sp. S1E-3]
MTRRTLALIALPLFCLLGAALLALFLALRPPPPEMPPLLRNLPADETAASAEFQRRLRERFPDHSLADDLLAELNAQGFETWPEAGLAHFAWHARPCTESWQVLWSAETGRLISLLGRRAQVCQ